MAGVASTFGKTAGGASTTTSSADKIIASKFTATDAGTLVGGHFRMWLSASGSTTARMLVYADSSGEPGAKLATSDQITLTTTATDSIQDFVFSGGAQIAISPGVTYWLAVAWDDPGTPSVTYSRDGTSSLRRERSDITYGTFPDPWGTSTGTFSGPIDVWADLNATGASGGGGGGTTTTPTVRATSTLGKSSTASATINVTKPSGLAVGDYLLGVAVGDADITLASMTATGFSTLSSQAGNSTSNYPNIKVFGKVADSSDVAASTFAFGFTSTGDGAVILSAITAGTYDTTTPVTVGTFTTTPRASSNQVAPSMTGVTGGLTWAIYGTDCNGNAETYPSSGPSGYTRVATVEGTPNFAMAGAYTKALTSTAATGTQTVTPTGTLTSNGWTSHVLIVNPKVTAGGPDTTGYTLIGTTASTSYLDTTIQTVSGQTRGVGGIPAPAAGAGVHLITSDSSSRLNITTSNTVWDGGGHTVGGITINADNVTVQNFKVQDATRDGVSIVGAGCTVQNCSIVRISSDGSDINGITLFGDGHKILYNEAGVSDFMATGTIGGSHTDFVQTWNTSSKRSTSNLIVQGNRVVGPDTGDARFIHQFVQGEGKGSTDGGGGGSGTSSGWLIADNVLDFACVNQAINLLDIHEVDITRNAFNGSASKRVGTGDGTSGVRYWTDNTTGGSASYGSIGVSTTAGSGPAGISTSTGGEPVPYTYLVTALDAAGNESGGGAPGSGSGGPPDTEAPTVPTNPVAVVTDGRVTLTWGESTDNVGVTQYAVYRDGTVIGHAGSNRFADVEVAGGTTYSYTVSALDAAGNESAQSSSVSALVTVGSAGSVPMLPGRLTGGKIQVSAAFGADLSADESTWDWTDITGDVRFAPGISTSLGRADESSTSNPAKLSATLNNSLGDYSLGTGSVHYPYIRRNTPIRVRIDPGDGKGPRVVFMGGADGWTPGWDSPGGKIPIVTLSASGTLRRLGQGAAPVKSAYRRVMETLTSAVAYWPLEEGKSATYAPALRGGTSFTWTGGTPGWASNDDFDCAASLPTMGDAYWQADVSSYTDTGASQLRMLLSIPDGGLPDGTVLMHVSMSGTIHRWDLTYGTINGGRVLGLYRYNASDGSLNSSDQLGFDLDGKPGRLSLDWTQSGSNIVWTLGFTPAVPDAVGSYVRSTLPGRTAGIVTHIEINPHNANLSAAIGHLTIENRITSLFTNADELAAHIGDTATGASSGRLQRLTTENNVPFQIHGTGANLTDIDQMGPQLVGPLLDLLHDCELANQGQLWDGRSAGLSYTTRLRRSIGTIKLTVDASAGQLAPGFDPVDDDQRTCNRAIVTRLHGITATYEDTASALGTAAIGAYEDAVTVNTRFDQYVDDYAQWFVTLGTTGGYRYPSVTVDLAKSPTLAAAVLDIIPGERIRVTNLDTTLASFTTATVDLIVEGIAHELTTRTWRVTFQCSPYAPWAAGLAGTGGGSIGGWGTSGYGTGGYGD